MIDLVERLALQPWDTGGPSYMQMMREREEAKAAIERLISERDAAERREEASRVGWARADAHRRSVERERDALKAEVDRLRDALTLAANRLDRLALEDMPLKADADDWAQSARSALMEKEAKT